MERKIGSAIMIGLVVFFCSGCVKQIDLWGAKMAFSEGLDLHTGFNNISQVDDRRGLTPTRGTREARVENVKY